MDYKNKWLSSYETLLFNTPDGDLDIGQYALDGNGTGYYIRSKPKTEAQFEWVDLTYKVAGLKKVNIVAGGHAYYDEFLTASGATNLWTTDSIYKDKDPSRLPPGSVARFQSTAKKYWDTAQIKGYPQPSRTEIVTVIPPLEPLPEAPVDNSIALDVASNSGAKGSVSSYSWSHTCTGTNLLLAFGDSHHASTDRTVTGVTHNGVALTYVRSDVRASDLRSTIYYLIAPAVGAKTVAVTLSGTVTSACGGVVSYTGAKQSGQPDAHNGAQSSGTAISVSVTTVADNCWVFSAVQATVSLTCGNTQRWNVLEYFGSYAGAGSDTNGPKTPAGSQAMSWTQSGTASWAISAASFAPAVEVAPTLLKLKMIPKRPWARMSRLYKSLSLKGG